MKFIYFLIITLLPVAAFAQIVNGLPVIDVWIQYDAITGVETGTNSSKVSDADLAALGRAQVEYKGTTDPTTLMVDVTQTPPAPVVNPALEPIQLKLKK